MFFRASPNHNRVQKRNGQRDDCFNASLLSLIAAILLVPTFSWSQSPPSDSSVNLTSNAKNIGISRFSDTPSMHTDESFREQELFQSFDHTDRGFQATFLRLGDVRISPRGLLEIHPTTTTSVNGDQVQRQWEYVSRLREISIDGENVLTRNSPRSQKLIDGKIVQVWKNGFHVGYEHRSGTLKQSLYCGKPCKEADSLQVEWESPDEISYEAFKSDIGQSIGVKFKGDKKFEWEGLKAFDGKGEEIPSEMKIKDGALSYEFDLSEAHAPIQIDPIAHSPGSFTELTPPSQNNSFFGNEVSPAGDINNDGFLDLLVAQTNYTAPMKPGVNHGRALIYYGSSTGIQQTASWSRSGDTNDENFGIGESVGDLNGDNFTDLAISGYTWKDSNANEVGRVAVFLGGSSGLSGNPSVQVTGESAGSQFGRDVSGSDLNCDGQSDLVVGAPFQSTSAGSSAGRVYVYFGQSTSGGANPIGTSSPWTWSSDKSTAVVGFRVDARGNLDGANCSELTVGGPFYGSGGAAFVWNSPLSGSGAPPDTTLNVASSSGNFGYGINSAGDYDDDGFDDLVVGAPNEGTSTTGRVRVYQGGSGGISTTATTTIDGSTFTGTSTGRFGFASDAGDVNGDGVSDLIIGGPGVSSNPNSTNPNKEGAAYLFLGQTGSGLTASPVWQRIHNDSNSQYAFSVTIPGNLNSMSSSDPAEVVVGASLNSGPLGMNTGKIFVYDGHRTCKIGGNFFMNGADNPQNSCQYCDYNANPTGWTNKSNGATCDDGNSCTVMDQCMAGQCTGQQKDCDDGLSCTMDTCNESNGGQCEHTVTTGCAVNGTCYADGEAQPGAPCQVCDPNQSTTSFVTAAPGTSCDDGLFCTVNDQCNMNGNCVSGGQRNCEGTLPQDIVVCNNTFQCSESLDKCNFSDAKSNGTPCDDGNACTSSTTCQGGVCTGMTKDCSLEMPDPCREGVCNPDDGTCEVENVDTTCNGGLYQCQSGSCPDACTSDADCGEGAVCCTAERPCDPDPNDGDFECTADNLPPTANAGMDQQGISEGASVTLSGSQSSDPDGDDIESYSWSLIEVRCDAGTADVATMRTRLMNENDDWEMQTSSEQLTFTAPRPQCEGLTLIFQLVVSDGETQSNPDNDQNATVEVMYGEVDNNAPFARITGPPQADCGESVTLSGSESTDVDGDTLQYTWSVRSGEPAPQLSSMMGESIQVTIPNSVPSDTLYEISLTVFDGFVNSEPDVQVIAVDACEIGGDAGMGDAGAVDAGEGLPDGEPGGSGCLSSTTGQPGVPGALLGLLVGGVAIGVRRRRS